MTAIFIVFDQALKELVVEALSSNLCRGYTLLPDAAGRGTKTGEPHLGTHAWPSTNSAILCAAEDQRVDKLLEHLHQIDLDNPLLGLRAFTWHIDKTI